MQKTVETDKSGKMSLTVGIHTADLPIIRKSLSGMAGKM